MLIARGRKILRSLAATRHGIGARLLTGVLVVSASVTLILTALQLYIDYRRAISALDLRLNQIGDSYLGGLAEGLWNLDENQLRLQLSGLLRLPDIRAVEVREAGSTGHPLIVKLGETPTSFARVQEYPLVYDAQGRARTIGTLRIEATLAEVYQRLVDTALTILVSQAAQTFIVSLFILYIFNHLVTRHLSSIAADLGSYRINGEPPELSLQRRPPRNPDELQRVVTAFNTLSRDLHVAYRNLREVNDELAEDVAARRKTEAILRERDARIRRLIDANIIGILIWNFGGEILEANDAFLRIVGYDREDLAAERIRWTDLTPPELRDRDELGVREISTPSIAQSYEKEFVSKDGRRVPVLIGAANFEADAKEGVAFVLDISERKRAEVELRESEQNYRMLFEAIDEGFCTIEVLFDQDEKPVDYRFLQINPSFERQTGIKDAAGRRMREIAPQHEEHWFEIYGRIALTGEPMRFENEAKQLGRWYDVYAFRVEDPKRRRVGILFNDITERKRAETDARARQMELEHLNRVASMGQLTASIAHEVTQPIAATRTNASAALLFLNQNPPDLEEVRETLERIGKDADRAGNIVGRIRDHIKKAPPRKDSVDLNDAIMELTRLARVELARGEVSVQTHLTAGLSPVEGDRVQLQQVILNLILNAVEAMSSVSDGTRELSISTEQSQRDGVLVAVRDSGPGIDPDHLERVFQTFYTTKSSGVGMGLSICRSIINAHGGRLWAEANRPKGVVFRFTLPVGKRAS
jgi:PAS domain S-box-containing protein